MISMNRSVGTRIKKQSKGARAVAWSEFAVFLAACWIAGALVSSPFLGIHWLIPGDFKYSTAMYYHGITVPALVLLYLLVKKIFPLKLLNRRAYAVGAILSILCVGFGSILNVEKGLSVVCLMQIAGMVMADLLGAALLVAMVMFSVREKEKVTEIKAAFWLFFCSILAILIAAPLGHLAGWIIDLGTSSFPGLGVLLRMTDMKAADLQNNFVGSHSHLMVAAFLCALSAFTAIYYRYQFRPKWKRRITTLGLWITLSCLLLATMIYIISALLGWEPPSFFSSGPNGIPLDDLVLTIGEIGFLLLLAGLFGSRAGDELRAYSSLQKNIRFAVFLVWIFGFIGAVALGIDIEFHETFYGAGIPPALGALNDKVFIRAHLLFPFFLLPTIFTVLLAVGCKYNQAQSSKGLASMAILFVWISIVGMVLGLTGEFLWFLTLRDSTFLAGMVIMGIALVVGAMSLWPEAGIRHKCKHV